METLDEDLIWAVRAFVYHHFATTTLPPTIGETALQFQLSLEQAAGEIPGMALDLELLDNEPEMMTNFTIQKVSTLSIQPESGDLFERVLGGFRDLPMSSLPWGGSLIRPSSDPNRSCVSKSKVDVIARLFYNFKSAVNITKNIRRIGWN